MTEFSRLKRKKPNTKKIIVLVITLFVVIFLLKNTDGFIEQFFGK